ncbi:hypothetical protein B0H10DRAFT_1944240 [Mycena sp. CBHHK59/15]|nr:hypothetical protein B0H10DRAFT_1944240 [Mycena sp. CBHHK59/15]
MAVSISSLTAWITIEGLQCPVYALQHGSSAADATCWIPSQEGKKFSVNWSNAYRDRPIFAQLSIDGVVCSTHFMLDAFNHPRMPMPLGSHARRLPTSRVVILSLMPSSPPTFGTIRLELWEADIQRIVQAPFQHQYGSAVLEPQVIHETSKQAGAHHVKFGGEYVVPQATVNMVNGTRKGSEPVATFTFNYRPYDILMAGGIIPRPMVPAQTPVKLDPVASEIQQLEVALSRISSSVYNYPRIV